MIPLVYFFTGGGGVGTVTVSGETITGEATDPDNASASVRFKQDGTVDKLVNGVASQIDALTDWVIPNSAAPGAYEIRYTNRVGDNVSANLGSVAEDAWHPLSDGEFTVSLTQPVVGSRSSTFDIEIRQGSSGLAIASGEYTLTATVT